MDLGQESSNSTGKDKDPQGTLKTERTAVGPNRWQAAS